MADVQIVTVTLADGTQVQVVAGTPLHELYLALAGFTTQASAASPDIDLTTLRTMAWFMTPHGPQSVIEPATITEFRRRDYLEITAQQAADFFAGAVEIPDVSFLTGQELPAAMAAAAADDDSPFAVSLRAALGAVSVTAPMPTGNPVTDTANAQAAIDATPAGGAVLFRASATHYALAADLIFTKHITILGESSSANFAARSTGGLLEEPNTPPHLRGTVFEQHTAGKNIFTMDPAASGVALHMANIGGTWAPGIIDSDTGHGLEAVSAVPHLGHTDAGLMGFSLRNVQFYGHDGDHYAAKLTNPLLGRIEKVYGYGGGGIHLHGDGASATYGNMVLDDIYTLVRNAGTAHGFNMSHSSGTGPISYLTFIRPQCNLVEDAAASGVQYLFRTREAGSTVGYLTLIAPDMEGWEAGPGLIDFGGLSGAEVVGTPILSSTPLDGVNQGVAGRYDRFDASGFWTAPPYVNFVQARILSGGGGGGAGGDNLASGGGGGSAGLQASVMVNVTPGETYEVHVGGGGTGGTGGGAGANGGDSYFRNAAAAGGAGGGGGGGSTGTVPGGLVGGVGRTTVIGIAGAGAAGQFVEGGGFAVVAPPGLVGGGGGGGGNGTAGGAGGFASVRGPGGFPEPLPAGGGARGDQPTANGSAGQTATTPGSGGAGGGGAGTGGTGGAGGAGAHGLVEIWW